VQKVTKSEFFDVLLNYFKIVFEQINQMS